MLKKLLFTPLISFMFLSCLATTDGREFSVRTRIPADEFIEFKLSLPPPSASPEPTQEPRRAEKVAKAIPKPIIVKPVGPKAYADSLLSSTQFACLDKLWTKESHWNHRARNKYSGAYGIPQALPGSKMASAGADWRTNPITQVKWGINYVNRRYGSACGAWNHWLNYGWY